MLRYLDILILGFSVVLQIIFLMFGMTTKGPFWVLISGITGLVTTLMVATSGLTYVSGLTTITVDTSGLTMFIFIILVIAEFMYMIRLTSMNRVQSR